MPSASVSRSRTPSTWRGSSARPASRHARCTGETAGGRARPGGRRPSLGREVACLFTVDLYNEGVDLPTVDTVLFLRPTQSATIFLQQLGRGLRRAPGQAVLTVLDFIGQHRREFRFDVRYRALTGIDPRRARSRHRAWLPVPALLVRRLILDRVAQGVVLENVRHGFEGWSEGAGAGRPLAWRPVARGLPPGERARARRRLRSRGWSQLDGLRREAGFPTKPAGHREDELLRRVASLIHVDDPGRAADLHAVVDARRVRPSPRCRRSEPGHRRACSSTRSGRTSVGHASFEAALADAARGTRLFVRGVGHPDGARRGRGADGARGTSASRASRFSSHCTYRRDEILAGIGWADGTRKTRGQAAGVVYSEATNVDALLVTLHKEEKDFAPSTRYRDYPISADLFHWESQNATALASAMGSATSRERATSCCSCGRRAPTSSGPRRSSASGRLLPSSTRASARYRSPGASTGRCRSSLLQAGAVDAA